MGRSVPSSTEHDASITTVVLIIIIIMTMTGLKIRCYMWLKNRPRVATSWQKVLTRKAFQPFWSRKWPASLPASTAAMTVPFITQDWSKKQWKCKGLNREESAVGKCSF